MVEGVGGPAGEAGVGIRYGFRHHIDLFGEGPGPSEEKVQGDAEERR